MRTNNVKISIVVPVYNVEKYLYRCLDSIIKQTYKDYEVIIVNDGSSDDSGNIAEQFSKKDNRFYVIHQENRGLSGARNTGLSRAKGEYIYFLDSDDYIHSNLLASQIEKLDAYNLDCVGFAGYVIYLNEQQVFKFDISKEDYNCKMGGNVLLSKYIPLSTVPLYIYKTDFLRKNELYFEEGLYHEDMLFTPKFFLKNPNVMISEELLYYYDKREGSITTSNVSLKRYKDMCYIVEYFLEQYKKEVSFENNNLAQCNEKILITYLLVADELYINVNDYDAKLIRKKMLNGFKKIKITESYRLFFVCRFLRLVYVIRNIRRKLR